MTFLCLPNLNDWFPAFIEIPKGSNKVIAIHLDDPEYVEYGDITDLPHHRLRE
jgi:hypothetical protein